VAPDNGKPTASELCQQTALVSLTSPRACGIICTAMKTVLVVEDTDDLRDLFVEVLRHQGYRVLGAENGQEALDILRSEINEPCLVLLDMMMPVMDGEEFLQSLDETHRAAALPIIVVSATVSNEGVPGTAGFVKKPVAPEVLITLVREYCGAP
jgi:CheY-like chemotaxis protein